MAVPCMGLQISPAAGSGPSKTARLFFWRDSLSFVPIACDFAMRSQSLAKKIESGIATSVTRACSVASLGTSRTGRMDSLKAIGEVCRRDGCDLHVDAAWAGSALTVSEARWMSVGIEPADNFALNPHKWLGVIFDCSAHCVRDAGACAGR